MALTVTVLALAVLPHFNHVQPQVIGLFLLLCGWRLACLRWRQVPCQRWLVVLVGFIVIIATLSWSGLPLGRDRGVAFLIVLLGLKCFEVKTIRDTRVALLLGLFVIVTHFLYADGASLMPYLLALVVAITWLMAQAEHGDARAFAVSDLKMTGKLLLQAIPFVIVLFYLFPRLPGSLFLFQSTTSSATTGLSETVSMGTVSSLIRSEDVAFTAEFLDGRVATPEQRYWRGSVFWRTNGKSWFRGAHDPALFRSPGELSETSSSERLRYEIEQQPGYQNWLFSLDLPLAAPVGAQIYSDHHIHSDSRIVRPYRYTMISVTDTRNLELTEYERSVALDPGGTVITPRLEALVQKFSEGAAPPRVVAQRMLDHFNQDEFIYTLRPPLLTSEAPVDEFLFESRRGFCGHYATSFATVMRLAGIPTRMVVGYLGGEHNPRSDQIVVRQSQAHAWTEIWLEDGGWTRVDPTLAIAPERIENAVDYQESLNSDRVVLFNATGLRGWQRLAIELEWIRDAIKAKWNRWFLSYDRSRQQSLLEQFGLEQLDLKVIGMMTMIVAVGLLVLMSFLLFFRDRQRRDPLTGAYIEFRNKLARKGVPHNWHEGPRDYQNRAGSTLPGEADLIAAITDEYVQLKYANAATPSPASIRQFSSSVRRYKPR